jgi:hypothetical protein
MMKRKTCFLLIAAVTLIAILGGCDDGGGLPGSPITFTGTWGDPTWTDSYGQDSRFEIFKHAPAQGIPANGLYSGSPAIPYPVPRVLTVNPDWSFTYTGGFAQAKIELAPGFYLYPRIVVKGTITWAEGQFYTITPTSGTIDLTEIAFLAGDNVDLPPETVGSFEEYVKISYDAARNLVIDDMPQTVTNGKGIMRGIWTQQ